MQKIFKFHCLNVRCNGGKTVNSVELPESTARNDILLLYCCKCGRVVQTKQAVETDGQGTTWLPCIEYKGPGAHTTNGPIPDDEFGVAWESPKGHISENEFIQTYGINPRIEWCNRPDPITGLPTPKTGENKIMCQAVQDECKGGIKPPDYTPLPPHRPPPL